MGEMADYALQTNVYIPDEGGYDGFDAQHMDEYGIVRHVPNSGIVRSPPMCKFCGSLEVYWKKAFGNWRIHNSVDEKPHTCKEYNKGMV